MTDKPITNDQAREIANWLYVVSMHLDVSRHLQSALFFYSEGLSPREYVVKRQLMAAEDHEPRKPRN